MSMASPPPWRWASKASMVRYPVTAATLCFASLLYRETKSTRSRRVKKIPRNSLGDSSSSSVERTNDKSRSEASKVWERAFSKIEKRSGVGESQAMASEMVVMAVEDSAPASRGRGSSGKRKPLLQRRPLWKRIFFASKKVRSIILLNVLTVIYASDIPALKEVEMIIDPALFTMVRFAVSAIPFLPFIFKPCEDCHIRFVGMELGFWLSLGYLSQAVGLLTSDAGRASFISAFTVIVVPLIDGMFGATIPIITWFGALLSLVGVAMLECGGSPGTVGDIFSFLSAVFFGIHMLRTEHISRNTKKEKFMSLLGYEVCTVALVSAIWFFLQGIVDDVHPFSFESCTWSTLWDWMVSFPWIPALYTGIFSTGLCLWAEMHAMRDISATETAIIYGLEPVWGAAFAWCLLGERWGTSEWLGAALVLCGSLTVQILGSTTEKSENEDHENCKDLSATKTPDDLSLSPVIINSRKSAADLLKKDKL